MLNEFKGSPELVIHIDEVQRARINETTSESIPSAEHSFTYIRIFDRLNQ